MSNLTIKILVALLSSYLCFVLPMILFGASDNAFLSFVTCSAGSYIAVILFAKFLIADVSDFFWILTGSFVIRLVIGVWHFLTFINPDYFNGDTSFNFLSDYTYSHTEMIWLADFRHTNGYFTLFPEYYYYINKYAPLHLIMSDLYFFGGNFPLNIAPYNTLFSLLSAIAITYFSKIVLCLSADKVRIVLLLSVLFPMGIISSTFFRDICGQFFIVLGVLIFSVQNKLLYKFAFILVAAFLFFLQRKIYVIIPIAAFILFNFTFIGKGKNGTRNTLLQNFLILAILLFTFVFSSSLLSGISDSAIVGQYASSDKYTSSGTSLKFYIFLPFYVLKAMIGPFPWTQFFEFTEGTVLQPQDYLMSSFMYAGLPALFLYCKRQILEKKGFTFIFLAGILLLFMGVASGGSMNQPYISIGYFLFIPTIIEGVNIYVFYKNFKIATVFFILSSILWEFVLRGSDIWGILRI